MRKTSEALALAARANRRFRAVLAAALILQAMIAVMGLVLPLQLAHWGGLEPGGSPAGWVRSWAGLLAVAGVLQLPGLFDPIGARTTVMIAIGGRFAMLIVYLCQGGAFLWLAALEGFLGVSTLVAFQALIRAELMTRA